MDLKDRKQAENEQLRIQGYTLQRLIDKHDLEPIGAFLTIGWLIHEPDGALQALSEGYDLMSEATSHLDTCLCLEGIFEYRNVQTATLRDDARTGKVDLLTCKVCGRHWLRIFYEPKVHNDAAEWYAGLIDAATIPSISRGDVLENTFAYLESLNWYYAGGTYWSDMGHATPFKYSGKIVLF
jgi:hypothetical protein